MSDSTGLTPRAFEDLYVAFYRHAFRDAPDVQQHMDEELCWVLTGMPLSVPNAVIRTHWEDETPESLHERVATTMRPFQMRQVPARWYVWPTSTPADLGERLLDAGLARGEDSPLMSCDLTWPLPPRESPSGVRIKRVSDPETFARWVSVAVSGFEFEAPYQAAAAELFSVLSYDESMRQYLALLDGEPAAVATLFLAGEVAGFFNIATLPKARGKGIGSAITTQCLHDARDAGRRAALLSSTALGFPVYRRLGFTTEGMVAHYFWRPEPAAG
jgi:ribosomal protein S18 acetylase RimI-like enzyme